MRYRNLRFSAVILVILSLSSCELLKSNSYFDETSSGRNVLSFTMNGVRLFQAYRGGDMFSPSPLHRFATYQEDKQKDSIFIEATLYNRTFRYISFAVPAKAVRDGVSLSPDVKFSFLYLPQISHLEPNPDYPNVERVVVDRPAEYRYVNIDAPKLNIRRWSREKKILAGSFTFEGNYTDSTGRVTSFVVTDGLFDVTDNTTPINPN